MVYGEDVKPIYAPFETSTALIKNGNDAIVALPQPAATAMAAQPCGHLGASFYDTWNEITGDNDGYPQVGAFAKTAFASAHPEWIKAFNQAVAKAIAEMQANPEAAVNEVADKFSFPAPVLLKALQATKFTVQSDQEMKDAVIHYYTTIGNHWMKATRRSSTPFLNELVGLGLLSFYGQSFPSFPSLHHSLACRSFSERPRSLEPPQLPFRAGHHPLAHIRWFFHFDLYRNRSRRALIQHQTF